MKRMTLLAALLAGCLPKPDTKTTPAEQKPVEVVVRVVTEGGINVVGSGTIDVKAQAPTASGVCECGCGKAGCACNRPELSRRDVGSRMDARTSDRVAAEPRPERDQREVSGPPLPVVFLYAPKWCDACVPVKAAFAARNDLPFRVVIKGEEDGVTTFPTISWTRSSDGARMWFTGSTWGGVDNVLNYWRTNK